MVLPEPLQLILGHFSDHCRLASWTVTPGMDGLSSSIQIHWRRNLTHNDMDRPWRTFCSSNEEGFQDLWHEGALSSEDTDIPTELDTGGDTGQGTSIHSVSLEEGTTSSQEGQNDLDLMGSLTRSRSVRANSRCTPGSDTDLPELSEGVRCRDPGGILTPLYANTQEEWLGISECIRLREQMCRVREALLRLEESSRCESTSSGEDTTQIHHPLPPPPGSGAIPPVATKVIRHPETVWTPARSGVGPGQGAVVHDDLLSMKQEPTTTRTLEELPHPGGGVGTRHRQSLQVQVGSGGGAETGSGFWGITEGNKNLGYECAPVAHRRTGINNANGLCVYHDTDKGWGNNDDKSHGVDNIGAPEQLVIPNSDKCRGRSHGQDRVETGSTLGYGVCGTERVQPIPLGSPLHNGTQLAQGTRVDISTAIDPLGGRSSQYYGGGVLGETPLLSAGSCNVAQESTNHVSSTTQSRDVKIEQNGGCCGLNESARSDLKDGDSEVELSVEDCTVTFRKPVKWKDTSSQNSNEQQMDYEFSCKVGNLNWHRTNDSELNENSSSMCKLGMDTDYTLELGSLSYEDTESELPACWLSTPPSPRSPTSTPQVCATSTPTDVTNGGLHQLHPGSEPPTSQSLSSLQTRARSNTCSDWSLNERAAARGCSMSTRRDMCRDDAFGARQANKSCQASLICPIRHHESNVNVSGRYDVDHRVNDQRDIGLEISRTNSGDITLHPDVGSMVEEQPIYGRLLEHVRQNKGRLVFSKVVIDWSTIKALRAQVGELCVLYLVSARMCQFITPRLGWEFVKHCEVIDKGERIEEVRVIGNNAQAWYGAEIRDMTEQTVEHILQMSETISLVKNLHC